MASGGGGTVVAAATALIVSFGIAIAAPADRPVAGAADDATARVATAGAATEPSGGGSTGGFSADELLGDLDLVEPRPDDGGEGADERVVPAVAGQVAGQLDTARGQLAAAVLSRPRLAALGLEPINGVDAPPPDRIGTAELVTPFYLLPASERYDPMMGDTGWVSGQLQVLQGSKGLVGIRTWAHAIPAGAALAFEIVQRTPLAVREPSTPVEVRRRSATSREGRAARQGPSRPAGSSRATHSTCCVIGNRSNARRPRRP